MTRNYNCLKTFLITFALVLLPLSMLGCASEQSSPQLAWPRLTRETRPWIRWWWMGSIVNEKDLTDQMEQYRKAGLGSGRAREAGAGRVSDVHEITWRVTSGKENPCV